MEKELKQRTDQINEQIGRIRKAKQEVKSQET